MLLYHEFSLRVNMSVCPTERQTSAMDDDHVRSVGLV